MSEGVGMGLVEGLRMSEGVGLWLVGRLRLQINVNTLISYRPPGGRKRLNCEDRLSSPGAPFFSGHASLVQVVNLEEISLFL